MVEEATVLVAAGLTGVPGRTIRNWITAGKLAARKGKRGYIVRVQEVRDVARIAGRDAEGSAVGDASAGGKAAQLAVADRDVQRAAAVIQEAMLPLVEEVGRLREELGRERARREEAERRLAGIERERGRARWWRRWLGD